MDQKFISDKAPEKPSKDTENVNFGYKKLLTVITVVKNDSDGLKETAHSIHSHLLKYKRIEFVIVTPPQIDDTYLLAEDIAARYPETKHIVQNTIGIYNAMNVGVINSSGAYLYFLNARDRLLPHVNLDEVLNLLNLENKPIYSGHVVISNGGINDILSIFPEKIPSLPKSLEFCCDIAHQATFINADIFKSVGLYDESYQYSGDYEFWCRCMQRQIEVAHLPIIMAVYDAGGVSGKKSTAKQRYQENRLIMEKYFRLKTIYQVFYDYFLSMPYPVNRFFLKLRKLHLKSLKI